MGPSIRSSRWWSTLGIWARAHKVLGAPLRLLRRYTWESIAAVCFVAVILSVNPLNLISTFARTNPITIVLMIPTVLGAYIFRGVAWWRAMRAIKIPITLSHTIAVELAGQILVFLPAGDLARVRLVVDTSRRKISAGKVSGSIAFAELLFLTITGFGVMPRVFSSPDVTMLAGILALFLLAIVFTLIHEPAYNGAIKLIEKIKLLRRFDQPLRRMRESLRDLMHPKTLADVSIVSAVAVGLSFLLFYLALQAIGATKVSFAGAAFILALSHILSGMSLVPGSVGAFEGLVTVFVIANGASPSQGAAAALLYRGFNDIFMAGVGGVFFALIRRDASAAAEQRAS